MMRFYDKTPLRPALPPWDRLLAGFLLLGGCSDSTTGSSSGSGDKKHDPALKALSQE